ncbi:MAG: hypothetical protein U0452_11365 [Anaerolineae bacterium]
MFRRYRLCVLMAVLAILVGSAQLVLADVAPPQQPPGESIGTGDIDTRVQMVSENVLVTVSQVERTPGGPQTSADLTQGHVEATFEMRNQGDESESLDVWFPLGTGDGFFNVAVVENFVAEVNGVPTAITQVELPGEFDMQVPWATWPVTFLPGETVELTVSYDLRPTGYLPYGEFVYVLETGAGWWGTIGEGTVAVRLPYDVTEQNVPFYSTSAALDAPEIGGTDIVWHFTDLEPTQEENIRVNVLIPSRWDAVQAAGAAVGKAPDSAQAYLSLAQAERAGLQFKYGLVCCDSLAASAVEHFQKALALGPDRIETHITYLDLMLSLWFPYDGTSYPADVPAVIASGLALNPTDAQLLDLVEQAAEIQYSSYEYSPDSETIQSDYQTLRAVLGDAAAANPGNARLQEIYEMLPETPGVG